MFEIPDLTRIKLDLLREIPRVYSTLLTRLNREGVTESDLLNHVKSAQWDGILEDYYDRFILHAG
ncbi:MAG: hypothetical protein HQL96_05215 [Magnetococcales bacterium]|nr:hypothetical protein [Magnetococcales bacterium]